ncbi:MAG TPA: hypothetical protein VMM14_02630 [Acidimicrobiia bacterium]|nr:hypothetical protein [Acidimicrobiia bacterium]
MLPYDFPVESSPGVYLYWIPLGAGGSGFVRLNGRIYEAISSRMERRAPHDIYHTAMVVHLPEGRFVVETMWPQPDRDTVVRGVAVEGPVFARWLSFTRTFRYEVRCWRDGILPDADDAVGGPQLISDDVSVVRSVVEQVPKVPAHTWGRRVPGTDDMWNSNSVVSWLLARAGVDMSQVSAPRGGRAPGWRSGISLGRVAVTT